jgi:glycosyltransferase involved in cell wall biosynthesis
VIGTQSGPAMTETERYVPAHRVEELRPRSGRYCIAVFVINEGPRLLAQLELMAPHVAGVDVIVADGGSTDGSTTRTQLEPRGVRTLLVKTGPGHLGAQMLMAFDYALREAYEAVLVMDGNNKDDPEAIPRFVAALASGCEHVQGSRYVAGGREVNTPFSRKWGVRLIHAPMIRRAARWPYTDTTNGFRAYSRALLMDPRVAPFRPVFAGYELHYYLAIRAARLGYRICEVPVTRAYPAHGAVPTKISPLRGNLRVLRALFAACRHRFDPRP